MIIRKLTLTGRKQEQTHLRNIGIFNGKDSETVKWEACMPQYGVRDLLVQGWAGMAAGLCHSWGYPTPQAVTVVERLAMW